MPGTEARPIAPPKKRMSFSQKLSKITGSITRHHHHKEPKDDHHHKDEDPQQRSSTMSNASTTASEASNASTAASTAPSLPPTREKYCTLRLAEDFAITIGDGFEPNPKGSLDDAWEFQYGPIRWPKFLRLLLVFPAVYPGEPLETLIFHADLHEVPFRMLKYDQGDDNTWIHVNGMKKLVSSGLHDALIAVRERAAKNAYTVLWIDELCCNQDDPVECSAHLRLKRDIVAACTGKTAVDSALNANFKRGRRSRRSVDGDGAESSQNGTSQQGTPPNGPAPSAYQRTGRGRNASNASELSGSTEIALSSRWQSRAQSVASMRTTERIGPSDSEGSPPTSEDEDEEDDIKGKKPLYLSDERKLSPRRARSPRPGSRPPRISLTFDDAPAKMSLGTDLDDDLKKHRTKKTYHVMKSQPL